MMSGGGGSRGYREQTLFVFFFCCLELKNVSGMSTSVTNGTTTLPRLSSVLVDGKPTWENGSVKV